MKQGSFFLAFSRKVRMKKCSQIFAAHSYVWLESFFGAHHTKSSKFFLIDQMECLSWHGKNSKKTVSMYALMSAIVSAKLMNENPFFFVVVVVVGSVDSQVVTSSIFNEIAYDPFHITLNVCRVALKARLNTNTMRTYKHLLCVALQHICHFAWIAIECANTFACVCVRASVVIFIDGN